jgi:hypothetical protein
MLLNEALQTYRLHSGCAATCRNALRRNRSLQIRGFITTRRAPIMRALTNGERSNDVRNSRKKEAMDMKGKTLRGSVSFLSAGLALLLSGCSNLDILNPKGSVGLAERDLIATSTWAMLIVVVPVIALTLLFAWRYRASNKNAEYRPGWVHSTGIEIAIWTIPTLIILFLAVLTWKTTHELDPYKPLESQVKPINVEVVALDWKYRVGEPVGDSGRHAGELHDHVGFGDELVLHPATRRPDLRDGRHADASAPDR